MVELKKSHLTTEEILGDTIQPCDRDADFIKSGNYYQWYYAIGQYKKPEIIHEMGVRYGYSLVAMCRGTLSAGMRVSAFGWDSEADISGSNVIASQNICRFAPVIIRRHSTDNFSQIPFGADIVHVDADHSEAGIRRELSIASIMLRHFGWIIVDDTDAPHIKAATQEFADRYCFRTCELPTLRGMMILSKYAI